MDTLIAESQVIEQKMRDLAEGETGVCCECGECEMLADQSDMHVARDGADMIRRLREALAAERRK